MNSADEHKILILDYIAFGMRMFIVFARVVLDDAPGLLPSHSLDASGAGGPALGCDCVSVPLDRLCWPSFG